MYRLCLVVLFVALWTCAILVPACSADEPKWDKVFGCEFKNRILRKWNLNYPVSAPTAGDLQAYVKDAFHFHDGSLYIEAREQDAARNHYTSGAMNTRGTFDTTFGRFEIRFRLPRGNGFHSQFSLLPVSSKSGSYIRIFDAVGTNITFSEKTRSGEPIQFKIDRDLSDDSHTISCVWQETSMEWSLDGNEVGRVTENVPNEKMFMVLNLAVKSGEDATTHFPNGIEVDYVRVYQSPSK